MRQEITGFWDAVASAGPYANNLHLAADTWPHQHLFVRFLEARCSSWRPADSVKALKAENGESQLNISYNNHKEWMVPAYLGRPG